MFNLVVSRGVPIYLYVQKIEFISLHAQNVILTPLALLRCVHESVAYF